jgi:diacylglycerol kinase family enzyme
LQDGKFNIQIFAVSKLKAMKIFFLAQKGLHLRESNVITKKSSNLILNTSDPIEIDGDYFDNGPAEIFIENRAIRFKI